MDTILTKQQVLNRLVLFETWKETAEWFRNYTYDEIVDSLLDLAFTYPESSSLAKSILSNIKLDLEKSKKS